MPQIGPQICALHHSSGKRDGTGSTGKMYRPTSRQPLGGGLVFSLAFYLFLIGAFRLPIPRSVP
jgi:hypothetical protein